MVKIMENPNKMDDLGVPLFLETPIFCFNLEVVGQNIFHHSNKNQPPFFQGSRKKKVGESVANVLGAHVVMKLLGSIVF